MTNASSDPLTSIRSLAQRALDQNKQSVCARRKLTQRFLKEIEKEIAEAKRMLDRLGQPWQRGDRTEYEFMRIALDKAMTSRKKERRERLLQSWGDLLKLKEKRLELLREAMALGRKDIRAADGED